MPFISTLCLVCSHMTPRHTNPNGNVLSSCTAIAELPVRWLFAGRSHHQGHGGDALLRGPRAPAHHDAEVPKAALQRCGVAVFHQLRHGQALQSSVVLIFFFQSPTPRSTRWSTRPAWWRGSWSSWRRVWTARYRSVSSTLRGNWFLEMFLIL